VAPFVKKRAEVEKDSRSAKQADEDQTMLGDLSDDDEEGEDFDNDDEVDDDFDANAEVCQPYIYFIIVLHLRLGRDR
jgi:hypothetical protein